LVKGIACGRAPVTLSSQVGREAWEQVSKHVARSLPEYEVYQLDWLQNRELWSRYSDFCRGLRRGGAADNERMLFHGADPRILDMISTQGFAPQLARGGEYGDGSYFAEHAIYPLAYQNRWQIPSDSSRDVCLLWVRCALGNCKDFGARCASDRGNNAAREAHKLPGLIHDFPFEGGDPSRCAVRARGLSCSGCMTCQGHRRRPPPVNPRQGREGPAGMFDSVSGTEANLEWTGNTRLISRGSEFGRQFVTFNSWQAYPELLIHLRPKRPA
jgi:hypothetical protein